MQSEPTERVIYVDRDGQPLPDKHGAVGGEIIASTADGGTEHTLFTLGEQPPQR